MNQQVQTQLVYAEGWALVMFLNRARDGQYKGQFDAYFRAEIRGEGGGEKFGEIFLLETDEDWEDFTTEFFDWVKKDLGPSTGQDRDSR